MNTPRTISEARRQANSYAKALAMPREGYRFLQYAKTPVYAIFKPENHEQKTSRGDYNVNLMPGKEACDCPDYLKHGDCCKPLSRIFS